MNDSKRRPTSGTPVSNVSTNSVATRNVAVRITPDAVRQVRGGSPWVFDGSIDSVNFDAPAGTVAVLFDRKRDFVGVGLYDPSSPIRVRVLQVGEQVRVDAGFFTDRIAAAVGRRAALRDGVGADGTPATTGYRLVNGENDQLPGLIADRYGDTVVIKLYSQAWIAHLETLVATLVDQLGPTTVVLRLARGLGGRNGLEVDGTAVVDGMTVYGAPPSGPVIFRENELWFEADVVSGQKTGHFLDQRDNRARVRALAAESDVLDVFASTGGFSVAAIAGGARSATLIDQSGPALAAAQRNFAHNAAAWGDHPSQVADQATMIVADAFDALEQLERASYDIVIVDPPSFAQNQASVPKAIAAYQRLTALALGLLTPGGILVQSSCSARVTADDFFAAVLGSAEQVGRPLGEIERTFHALDHPIGFEYGAYLKTLFAYAP